MMISLSPSSLERVASCPGSYWAEKGAPYQDSPYAAEGKLLHAVMSGNATLFEKQEMTSEQRNIIRACGSSGRLLRERYTPNAGARFAERKLQCMVGDEAMISGTIDYTEILEPTALIVDWKFGRTPETAAELNWQLGAYALLVKRNHRDVERVVVAIVQPRVEIERRETVAEYGPEELEAFESAATDIVAEVRASEKDPVRNPGERQCKYCKAAGSKKCPESQTIVKAIAPAAHAEIIMPTGAELGALLKQARAAEVVVKRITEHAKAEIAAGRPVPGWGMSSAVPIRTLPHVEKVWEAVKGVMTPEEFVEVCKVGVGDLQEALKKKCGWRDKDAKGEFAKLLGEAVVMDEKAGSLVEAA